MAEQKLIEAIRKVTLSGVRDVMFDRYPGDNDTKLRDDQKMYLDSQNHVTLPSLNLMSLLSAQSTMSAPKRFLDSRKYKAVAQAILSFVSIDPELIPFTRNGEPVIFNGFGPDGKDPVSGIYVRKDVARLDKGIPNPKSRPVLPMPWELKFTLHFFKNDEVQEETVQNLLIRAGVALGIGTFRGVFGKFVVKTWE